MNVISDIEINQVAGAMGGGGYSARNDAGTACGDGVLGGIVAGFAGFVGGPVGGFFGMIAGGFGGGIAGGCLHVPIMAK